MSTTFTTIHTDSHRGDEWPDAWEEIVTRVDGDLADKIRAKVGAPADAEVQIFERGDEGGWSEFTVEWDWCFRVEVAGIEVWSTDGYSEADFADIDTAWRGGQIGRFVEWVNQ